MVFLKDDQPQRVRSYFTHPLLPSPLTNLLALVGAARTPEQRFKLLATILQVDQEMAESDPHTFLTMDGKEVGKVWRKRSVSESGVTEAPTTTTMMSR